MVTGNVAALELVEKLTMGRCDRFEKFYWIYFAKSITR
jgi:hypothetical protein